jgi:predicted O-methyltransferase YrrM
MGIILRATRVLHQQGIQAAFRRAAEGLRTVRDDRRCMNAIARLAPDATVDTVVDLVFSWPMRPWQHRVEIEALVNLVAGIRPRAVLEIGTAQGGTLFLWTRIAHADATLISVDLRGGRYGGGSPEWKAPLFRSFALPNQVIHLLNADSHATATTARVLDILDGRPLDFLFIDGDHSYAGVKQDFERYGPLVRSGGIIAFHDIVPGPAEAGIDVARFWQEVKTTHQHREFIADPKQKNMGIGVLFQR